MNYFLDTEFAEDGHLKPLGLISIGIVDEEGHWYYAENEELDLSQCNDWVKKNVIPYLKGPRKSRATIMKEVMEFMPPASKPHIWAYYADYDWVLFCQLFGKMTEMPKGYPYYCRDLKQWADQLGIESKDFPNMTGTEHHALEDARWNRELYNFLKAKDKR